MRVIYLMDQMYLHGGAEKIVSSKINFLIENFGYEVFLITSGQRGKKNVYPLSSLVNQLDIKINYTQGISFFHPINLLKTVQHFFKLKRVFKKIDPDIIVSVSQTPDQFFLPFISKETPKIKEFHSSGINLNLSYLKQKLFNLYKLYNTLVLLNKEEEQYYRFSNTFVIPNFIKNTDDETFTVHSNRKKTIIAAGRIASVKQFDHLILAWEKIADFHKNWFVEIYGDGDDKLAGDLNKLISERNISNIKLMGSTTILNEKMKNASIYAMTSATECFPMVLLEAMANGLPIVSYNCPHGPAAIIEHNKQGYLTETNNISNFAKKLSYLITSDSIRLKMSEASIHKAKQFQDNLVMAQWRKLFLNINK